MGWFDKYAGSSVHPLQPAGQDKYGNKFFLMDVRKDSFIHFTSQERIPQILQSGKLLLDPPHQGMGAHGVFAISLTYGEYVPGVATDHIGKYGKLGAIRFRTSTVPLRASFREETAFGEQDVILEGAEVIDASIAVTLIRNAPVKIGDQDMVFYDKALLPGGAVVANET